MALGAVDFIRTLPDHRLLDRLVRGRAWIPVLGVLLAGIVATQVEVLKRWVASGAAVPASVLPKRIDTSGAASVRRMARLATR